MGKHSAAPTKKEWIKALRIPALILAALLVLATAIALPVFLFGNDPYEQLLENGGITPTECREEDGTLYLTFEGDVEGILSCRNAINLLRQSDITPKNLCWTLKNGETVIKTETLEDLGYLPPAESPRVETLDEESTELKLVMELTLNHLKYTKVTAEKAPDGSGKILTVHIDCPESSAPYYVSSVRAALKAVNTEGGGIQQCNVFFDRDGTTYAAAAIDLEYGDTLLSSLLEKK